MAVNYVHYPNPDEFRTINKLYPLEIPSENVAESQNMKSKNEANNDLVPIETSHNSNPANHIENNQGNLDQNTRSRSVAAEMGILKIMQNNQR